LFYISFLFSFGVSERMLGTTSEQLFLF
jgi:hypothetical protein